MVVRSSLLLEGLVVGGNNKVRGAAVGREGLRLVALKWPASGEKKIEEYGRRLAVFEKNKMVSSGWRFQKLKPEGGGFFG